MGVHARPAFLHLQEAVLHPILQLQHTTSSSLLWADGFSEPIGKIDCQKMLFFVFPFIKTSNLLQTDQESPEINFAPQIQYKLIYCTCFSLVWFKSYGFGFFAGGHLENMQIR